MMFPNMGMSHKKTAQNKTTSFSQVFTELEGVGEDD